MNPTCKIYLFTYKRNKTLNRSVQSLINQNYKDWICEVHNDDPYDKFPEELVRRINDTRIKVVNHVRNLGPTASFNLMYDDTEAEYVSLLEDDNWWEPGFLAKMVKLMEANPEIHICWSNMKKWKENKDGSWEDTGEYVWPVSEQVTFFNWPNQRQMMGALHSNGAMLVRKRHNVGLNLKLPSESPSSMVEYNRERLFDYPIVLCHEYLANFAITLNTSRPGRQDYICSINAIILFATYIKYDKSKSVNIPSLWKEQRRNRVKHTHIFIWAAIMFPEIRYILRYTSIYDWLFFMAYYIKNYREFTFIFLNRNKLQDLKDLIDKNTKLRFEKATRTKNSNNS